MKRCLTIVDKADGAFEISVHKGGNSMGLFDTDNTDMFGGFFDFDDDGKVSWDEEFIAHKIIADCIKGEEDDKLDYAIYDESVSFDAGGRT